MFEESAVAKLRKHLSSGEGRSCLMFFALSCITVLHAATYTMSGSADIPLVGGAYSFAAGDKLVVDTPTTNATPILMNGDLTISGTAMIRQTAPISGSGNLHFTIPDIPENFLDAPLSLAGNLYVDLGVLIVTNAHSLGVPTIYINEEATSGKTKRLVLKNGGRTDTFTVTNAFVIGSENTANWQTRFALEDGKYVVTGPITIDRSKIHGQNGTVSFQGPISGNKVIFDMRWDETFSIETPVRIDTGDKEFWIGNQGKIYLNTAGCVFSKFFGFNTATLVCGGDYYYPSGANFASQNTSGAHAKLDLNGHNQILGSFSGQGALVKPFTILNSKAGTCPTVTIRQTANNATTNLHFSGTFNLVKEGTALLAIGEAVNGTITVKEGILQLGAPVDRDIARKVVVDGGVLDLGGRRVTCRTIEIKGGGSVRNGTIAADRVVTDETAHLNSVSFALDKPNVSYAHPTGTVIHFPFDGSLTTALRDATTNEYDLSVKSGSPVYSAEGLSGGCLYFDGSTILEIAPFPELVPTSNAPYTVSLWAKAAEGCNNRGGWIGYGKNGVTGGSNNFRLHGSFTTIWNYWWSMDVSAALPSGDFKDGWHHVVGTYDGSTRRIYCDGVLQTTNSSHTPNFGNEQFLIGTTLNDANFTGWIDDLLIANRAFTDKEVATLYQDGGISSTQSGAGPTLDVSGGTLAFNSSAVYYPFNSAATLLSDSSGNGADLHVAGGSSGTFSSDSPFATGGSIYFDGSTWLEASAFPSSMPTGNMVRTIACFIKPATDCAQEGAVLSWGYEGSSTGKYMNFALRQYGARLGLFPWGSDNVYVSCTKSDILNSWNSFTAVWDGSQVTLYTNGVLAVGPKSYVKNNSSENLTLLDTPAGGFKIGKAYYNGTSYYKGNMAELAVWDRVLTAAEIATYHQSGAAGLAPGVDIAHLFGTGNVRVSNLTVAGSIDASLAISGDLVLADGVTVAARDAPTTVSGALAIAGGGTVTLPAFDAPLATWTLFTASSISGASNLADWSFTNLPRGKKATVQVQGDAVVVTVADAGMMLIFR